MDNPRELTRAEKIEAGTYVITEVLVTSSVMSALIYMCERVENDPSMIPEMLREVANSYEQATKLSYPKVKIPSFSQE